MVKLCLQCAAQETSVNVNSYGVQACKRNGRRVTVAKGLRHQPGAGDPVPVAMANYTSNNTGNVAVVSRGNGAHSSSNGCAVCACGRLLTA